MTQVKTPPAGAPPPATPPAPPTPPAATGTSVKFLKSHHAYGYHAGETGELPADQATQLVASGHCQAVVPQTDETR